MNPKTVQHLFTKLSQAIPNPKTELVYSNPFELLIAVMLRAQATDVSVNKVTPTLFELCPTPESIVRQGEAALLEKIKTIGLAKTKARHIVRTCQLLLECHQGQVPDSREALEALPGVGRKTANVILNTAFGQEVVAVDTHVFRVSNRTGLAPGKTPLEVEEGLMKVIPKKWRADAHHLLILHGRYTCKARKPNCLTCVIEPECGYADKGQ